MSPLAPETKKKNPIFFFCSVLCSVLFCSVLYIEMASGDEEMTGYPRRSGKTVLVTRASSGIGEATAKHLAFCGANLILWARRQDRLDALAADIKASFPRCQHV